MTSATSSVGTSIRRSPSRKTPVPRRHSSTPRMTTPATVPKWVRTARELRREPTLRHQDFPAVLGAGLAEETITPIRARETAAPVGAAEAGGPANTSTATPAEVTLSTCASTGRRRSVRTPRPRGSRRTTGAVTVSTLMTSRPSDATAPAGRCGGR